MAVSGPRYFGTENLDELTLGIVSVTLVLNTADVVVVVVLELGEGVLTVVVVAGTNESVDLIALFVVGEFDVVLPGIVKLVDTLGFAKVGIELLDVVGTEKILFDVHVTTGVEANAVAFALLDG